jgi:hypothetical protein
MPCVADDFDALLHKVVEDIRLYFAKMENRKIGPFRAVCREDLMTLR